MTWPEQKPTPDPTTPTRRCRVCGCTDEDCTLCAARTGRPCTWIASTLCSACAIHQLPWLASARRFDAAQVDAISLWQPWASLLAWGIKQNETRGWRFERRTLAIHATASEPAGVSEHLQPLLDALGWTLEELPRAAVVGFARFGEARSTDFLKREDLVPLERIQGDYGPDRWAMPATLAVPIQPIDAIATRQKIWAWRYSPREIAFPERAPWPHDRSQADVYAALVEAAERIEAAKAEDPRR